MHSAECRSPPANGTRRACASRNTRFDAPAGALWSAGELIEQVAECPWSLLNPRAGAAVGYPRAAAVVAGESPDRQGVHLLRPRAVHHRAGVRQMSRFGAARVIVDAWHHGESEQVPDLRAGQFRVEGTQLEMNPHRRPDPDPPHPFPLLPLVALAVSHH